MKPAPTSTLSETAVMSILAAYGEDSELVSVEALDDRRVLVTTVFGPLLFTAVLGVDGKVSLSHHAAPLDAS